MTPTAARGVLSAVLWKPAIEWRIERVQVLAPIQFTSFRRNEVNSRVPTLPASLIRDGGAGPVLYSDEDRAQRNTVALRDVDYMIEARFFMTERAGRDDSVIKFEEIFRRRVARGQCFTMPYLGCREFVADVLSPDGAPAPIDDSRSLGRMVWDIVYENHGGRARVHFFDAVLSRGILEVPPTPTITRLMELA